MFRCKLLVSFVEGAAFDEHSPRKSKAANLLAAISVHGPCPCKRNSRPRNRESSSQAEHPGSDRCSGKPPESRLRIRRKRVNGDEFESAPFRRSSSRTLCLALPPGSGSDTVPQETVTLRSGVKGQDAAPGDDLTSPLKMRSAATFNEVAPSGDKGPGGNPQQKGIPPGARSPESGCRIATCESEMRASRADRSRIRGSESPGSTFLRYDPTF